MNFDIKYTENLKTYNFIKIKQVLEVQWGTQSWGHLARVQDQAGCNLGTLNSSTDVWGPPVSDSSQ